MVVGPDFSTSVQVSDYDDIDALLTAAYQSKDAAEMVRHLRADGDIWFESKTPWLGKIGGYYAIARMREPSNWGCLVAMAVRPEFQQGVLAENNPNMEIGGDKDEAYRGPWRFGKRMAGGIASYFTIPSLAPKLPEAIVAIGKPAFFERNGWSSARARNLRSVYPADDITLLRFGDDIPEQTLVFPKVFSRM